MNYLESLNSLSPQNCQNAEFVALDLFAGCGGLSLGFESAGIKTIGIEKDAACVETYKSNLSGDCFEQFIDTDFDFPYADIVIGGPPCQPFSVGGKQLGLRDSRDGFPAFIRAIEQLRPRIFIIENVRGMKFRSRSYFGEVLKSLSKLNYDIQYEILNAKMYGVPQNRERLFVAATKNTRFEFPAPEAHVYSARDAIADTAFNYGADDIFLTSSQDAYVAKYEKASKCVNPRDLNLDKPARTLTCRNLAGATGDMHRLLMPDGRRRRLSVRESARLQSFPDWFRFSGTKASQFYQIGNAVPPVLSYKFGVKVLDALYGRSGNSRRQLPLKI